MTNLDSYRIILEDRARAEATLSKLKGNSRSCSNCSNFNHETHNCRFHKKVVKEYNICISHGKVRL